MNRLLIAAPLAIALLAGAAQAQAQTLVATSNIVVKALDRSIDFTSDTTTSIRDMKVVSEARDDAASFVASAGAVRGAQLEAAFGSLRERFAEAREASDLQLAEAILAL
ncbi:DUF2388 domain-containing protein [Pseudomonas sp. S5(2021)]|jgi:uncharacterized protein (TIGR02448 family)|nr:DUF2388 domain-containing protein [Stutzerimonas balearica]MBZ5754241.1 DUF2388 domain-containing protein [Pseudomonas sp. S5(2021)]